MWCRAGSKGLPCGRLLSCSIDGSVSEWDIFHLKQKNLLETIGVSIWQMAVAPSDQQTEPKTQMGNGHLSNYLNNGRHGGETSESEDESDSDSAELREQLVIENQRVALACDDGCVRIYTLVDDDFVYTKSLPRVRGRTLSVTWSPDSKMIFSGSSDGLIRCWNPILGNEIYRITVGLGGLGSGSELCVWSLLSLRSGTLVSADSTGSVQFWDSKYGTLLQGHSYHKGDANALAAAPGHNRVFSAGSDGQVILYKLSSETMQSTEGESSNVVKKWIYVDRVRKHTHDVRALTVAVPTLREGPLPDQGVKRIRCKKKPIEFKYRKWAHSGVPMLISAGDDTKLYAYSAKDFTQFEPHDICPAPQRLPIQMVLNTVYNQSLLLLVQASSWLDIMCVRAKNGALPVSASGPGPSRGLLATDLLFRVKSKASRRIICSTISNSGLLFAYSDHVKPTLYELKRKGVKNGWTIDKRLLPRKLPYAHSMVFSSDSSRLMIAGHDRRINVVDVVSSETIHVFTPCKELHDEELPPSEPPITKMFTSSDGQWLAAINCFGDVYIFNLEIWRQHWFISRLDGASITAGGFSPRNNNVLIVTTSSNQVYALDVEDKKLGDWSKRNTHILPKRFQEFPGEVIGLSFPPASSSLSSVIVYSASAFCWIDFGMPVDQEDESGMINGQDTVVRNLEGTPVSGRLKRKLLDYQTKIGRKNFEFFNCGAPILFVGHLSQKSVLVMEKQWKEVIKTFEAPPVDRHIFGT